MNLGCERTDFVDHRGVVADDAEHAPRVADPRGLIGIDRRLRNGRSKKATPRDRFRVERPTGLAPAKAVSTVSWPAAANSDVDERDEVTPYGNESQEIFALENVIETATIT
jgi:hypothetical protein